MSNGDDGSTIGAHDNSNDKTSKRTMLDHDQITKYKIDNNSENNLYKFILKV